MFSLSPITLGFWCPRFLDLMLPHSMLPSFPHQSMTTTLKQFANSVSIYELEGKKVWLYVNSIKLKILSLKVTDDLRILTWKQRPFNDVIQSPLIFLIPWGHLTSFFFEDWNRRFFDSKLVDLNNGKGQMIWSEILQPALKWGWQKQLRPYVRPSKRSF